MKGFESYLVGRINKTYSFLFFWVFLFFEFDWREKEEFKETGGMVVTSLSRLCIKIRLGKRKLSFRHGDFGCRTSKQICSVGDWDYRFGAQEKVLDWKYR